MAFEQFLLSEKIVLLSMIYTPKMEKNEEKSGHFKFNAK